MMTFEKMQLVKEMIMPIRLSLVKEYYKIKAIYLSKQQALNGDTKAKHQINFTRNLAQQATMFFIIEEAKKLSWIFHKEF